jgi:hypothetical protein
MRFVLVNGRSPCRRSFCAACEGPIGGRYLREVGTYLIYCDHNCYADHCSSAVVLLERRAFGGSAQSGKGLCNESL